MGLTVFYFGLFCMDFDMNNESVKDFEDDLRPFLYNQCHSVM